jgi:hypothetical protein
MQIEISPYNATEYRDVLARLALQRTNIMHLVGGRECDDLVSVRATSNL